MDISAKGIALIKGFEGLRLVAYQDIAGVWTMGYGSTRYADGRKVKKGDKLVNEACANDLLLATLKNFVADVNRLIKVPLTQSQFDALVSWHYNTNGLNAKTCTLRTMLNAKNYQGAADQLDAWNKVTDPETKLKKVSDTLTKRRAKEKKLFLTQ